MMNFYSKCCDCGVDYCEIQENGQAVLQCPSCKLTTTYSEIEKLTSQLERDLPCLITRLEAQQEIQARFPKVTQHLNSADR